MIFYDTISPEQILIGRQYSVIGPNYIKNEEIVTIVDCSTKGNPIDDTGFLWPMHVFAEPLWEYFITNNLSQDKRPTSYIKSIILNNLYRIIPYDIPRYNSRR